MCYNNNYIEFFVESFWSQSGPHSTASIVVVFFFNRKSRERVMTTPTEMVICHKYKDCPFFFNSTESYHFCLERFPKVLDGSSGEPDRNRGQNTSWF